MYYCYEEVEEAAVLFRLVCIVSLLKYTVNCIGLCCVFVCSVPFELLSLNHSRISDVTSLELKTLTVKLFSLTLISHCLR